MNQTNQATMHIDTFSLVLLLAVGVEDLLNVADDGAEEGFVGFAILVNSPGCTYPSCKVVICWSTRSDLGYLVLQTRFQTSSELDDLS